MVKCTNCNQFINEKDKFCKFCGCPTPYIEEIKQKPKTEKQIIDEIQLDKTIVTDDNINCAQEMELSCLQYKIIGDKNSIRARNIVVMAIAMLVAVTCLVLCFLFKTISNEILAFGGLLAAILLMFFSSAVAAERFTNITMVAKIENRRIHLPRYGLKKTPIFLLGGSIFQLIINDHCPACDGEIRGDLHVERIHDCPVAVCNYNRKHVYYIPEQKFFDSILGIDNDGELLPRIAPAVQSDATSVIDINVSITECPDNNIDSQFPLDSPNIAT